MSRAQSVSVAVFLALGPPAAAAKISLVVGDGAAHAGKNVTVLAFDRVNLSDPIAKGRFLAALNASDRIIAATGGRACGWLGREIEEVPIQCFMPYDGRQVLDFARAAGWRRVAAVHVKGYEKIYAHLRTLARKRGIELISVRVERLRDLTAALPGALNTVQAVWILGDPLLSEGAAFDYLVEASLARRIPLIGPGAELVARGAFLGAENDRAALIRYAVGAANAAAAGAPAGDTVTEIPGGRLVVNKVLVRRWGVSVPEVSR